MHPPSLLSPIAIQARAPARLGPLCGVRPRSFLVFAAIPGFAQFTNGSLSGRVTDPFGAVIVDANVVVIRADTNVRFPERAGLGRLPQRRILRTRSHAFAGPR